MLLENGYTIAAGGDAILSTQVNLTSPKKDQMSSMIYISKEEINFLAHDPQRSTTLDPK